MVSNSWIPGESVEETFRPEDNRPAIHYYFK